jgi:hypothetical protein
MKPHKIKKNRFGVHKIYESHHAENQIEYDFSYFVFLEKRKDLIFYCTEKVLTKKTAFFKKHEKLCVCVN